MSNGVVESGRTADLIGFPSFCCCEIEMTREGPLTSIFKEKVNAPYFSDIKTTNETLRKIKSKSESESES